MKIDRRNPVHWCLLGAFFMQALCALLLRCLLRRASGVVVLYGHKLNGNLLALYKRIDAQRNDGLRVVFLTMDRAYQRELLEAGFHSVWVANPACVRLLSQAVAVISDHGLHSMQPLVGAFQRTGLRFFDVWHGIPFKGFDAHDFRLQHRYDETWVASELCRELYVKRFGFSPDRVVATGYARTDQLLEPSADSADIRRSLGLPTAGPLLLFAPTWKQDAAGRSLYPFGCKEHEFLEALSALAARHGGSLVLRSHLNSGDVGEQGLSNVYALPASRFPDTELILQACDILICDWSSIAFDFLLLDRPTFFLDVEPPFRKGFSLGPEYRFGPVTASLPVLLDTLDAALLDPLAYWRAHAEQHRKIRSQVYGGLGDGGSAERCVQRLQAHLATDATCGSSR